MAFLLPQWAMLAGIPAADRARTGYGLDTCHLFASGYPIATSRADLTQVLDAFEAATGHQIVVVTLPSLQGYEIEDYGYQLGRTWQIGQKGKNDGALFIIAPTERKVRIEVGYGLEGVMTDALSNVIITRLPFAVPDHPLTASRIEHLEEQGLNAFTEYSVPEAILKLRQGVGRLIRTATDKGICAILDNRILTKPYGRAFLAKIGRAHV